MSIFRSVLLASLFVPLAWAYDVNTDRSGIYVTTWDPGAVAMQIRLPTDANLQDGTSFASSVQAAMATWNSSLGVVQFTSQVTPTASPAPAGTYSNGDRVNQIVMDSTYDGTAFGTGVLAITLYYTSGNSITEADIVFNTSWTWDSYRGNLNGRQDIRRVAIHELGHVLGLNHPDQATPPQSVTAIMNSRVSNIDTLQADDIAGAQLLYGAPGFVPANNNFANAISITLSNDIVRLTGTNIAATKESGEPAHAGANAPTGHSVWWKWTATDNRSVTVMTLDSNFDTVLSVYTGSTLTTLVPVSSNDDVQNGVIRTSAVTFNAVRDTTYLIAVDGWGSVGTRDQFTPTGQITLSLKYTVGNDFNGDGKADIFLSNTVTGDRATWLMNGSTISTNAYVGNVPAEWVVSGTGDFNGDGKADILWSNTMTGDRAMWLMNGTTVIGGGYLGVVPVAWVVSGTGDFNGDGKADIVWTNTATGERAMWLMNGSTVSAGASLGVVPVAWVVSGIGDFNGDRAADIVLSNTATGDRAIWFMNGSTISTNAFVGTVPLNWQISHTGDFNGDGKADLFWTNTSTGERTVWLMNGSTLSAGGYLGVVPVAWVVSNTGDYNGDGKADVLWSNTSTGERAMWLMNGLTTSGGASLGVVPVAWVPNN